LKRSLLGIGIGIGISLCATAAYHAFKPLPPGLSVETPARVAQDVRFLADLTYVDPQGVRHVDQQIFDEILAMIGAARKRIVLDLFLYNDFQGARHERTRALCAELTEALLARKRAVPEIEIVLITDPVNTVYGGISSTHLEQLTAAGISVVICELDALRDSNGLYSTLWRWLVRPLGRGGPGLFENPFGGDPISLRTQLRVLNFKANHRKTIVADSPDGWTALVTSANPHDGSSAHGNLAVRFSGRAVADLLETERAVVAFSGSPVPDPIEPVEPLERPEDLEGTLKLALVTEGKIARALERTLAATGDGDEVEVAVFYLSDRRIVRALVDAHARGASVRVLLDPNKDAFGRERNGVPNRPVAAELRRAGLQVRWCDTHGEQCHAKMLLVRSVNGWTLVAGSANFTRRNLRDLNLETSVLVTGSAEDLVLRQARSYFERVWSNEPGRRYSVDYAVYADESWIKTWLYWASELSGIGTF
jgi:phosphatidylserine/phosphatidylglycerophosphate/cardiolipin synthase-like enzyme